MEAKKKTLEWLEWLVIICLQSGHDIQPEA